MTTESKYMYYLKRYGIIPLIILPVALLVARIAVKLDPNSKITNVYESQAVMDIGRTLSMQTFWLAPVRILTADELLLAIQAKFTGNAVGNAEYNTKFLRAEVASAGHNFITIYLQTESANGDEQAMQEILAFAQSQLDEILAPVIELNKLEQAQVNANLAESEKLQQDMEALIKKGAKADPFMALMLKRYAAVDASAAKRRKQELEVSEKFFTANKTLKFLAATSTYKTRESLISNRAAWANKMALTLGLLFSGLIIFWRYTKDQDQLAGNSPS